MTEQNTATITARMTAERARVEARKQTDNAKFIQARIKATKAKRQTKRPKPRVEA